MEEREPVPKSIPDRIAEMTDRHREAVAYRDYYVTQVTKLEGVLEYLRATAAEEESEAAMAQQAAAEAEQAAIEAARTEAARAADENEEHETNVLPLHGAPEEQESPESYSRATEHDHMVTDLMSTVEQTG
jgi:hypothetical protein